MNDDAGGQPKRRRTRAVVMAVLAALSSGCAAFRSDLDGIPPRFVPPEYRAPRRNGKRTIDLSLLRRTPPDHYRVDSGDVLGVFVEGVLGQLETPPPISNNNGLFDTPGVGFPIAVRDDGTIALPDGDSVFVRGLTLPEIEAKLRRYYSVVRQPPLIRGDRARVLVSLQRPRTYRVLVVRQESGNRQGNLGSTGTVTFEIDKRGTGRIVELPAYQNDVLHALAATGGLPGLDAQNAVYVIRRRHRPAGPGDAELPSPTLPPSRGPGLPTPSSRIPADEWERIPRRGPVEPASHEVAVRPPMRAPGGFLVQDFNGDGVTRPSTSGVERRSAWGASSGGRPGVGTASGLAGGLPYVLDDATISGPGVRRIPLRMFPGEPIDFTEEDVTLRDGDVVFLETRETEFFFTGGLLGGGQYALPRDYDIDVLGAIAIVEQRGSNRALLDRSVSGPSATGLDVTTAASRLIVLRTLPDGRQVTIEVDLYEALKDPAARPIVAPGDYLFLRYTRAEACAAFFERWLFDNVATGFNNSTVITGNGNN